VTPRGERPAAGRDTNVRPQTLSEKRQETWKHSLIDPASSDMAGKGVPNAIDKKARVWTVRRGGDGKLEEELNLEQLMTLSRDYSAE